MARRIPLLALTAILAVPFSALRAQSPDQAAAVSAAIAEARDLTKHHKYHDAEKSLKTALKLSGNSCRQCYLSLVTVYWSGTGDERAAFQMLDRAFDLSPTNEAKAEVRTIRGNLLLGLHDAKKLKDAETEYQAALTLSDQFPTAHYGLGVAALREMRDEDGKRELNTYLQLLPEGSEAEAAKLMIANPRRAREHFAPDFTARGLHGERITLKDYAGKVVILDFWATWCGPCVASVGDLKDLVHKYSADKVVLISISNDRDEDTWRSFIQRKDMNWIHIFDEGHKITDDFNVKGFPTYMIIDAEGVIREQIVGEDNRQSVAYRLKDKLKALPQLKGN